MKSFGLGFTLTCLVGMVVSLLALYQSTNNDQIILSIWLFIAFGMSGTIVLYNNEGLK